MEAAPAPQAREEGAMLFFIVLGLVVAAVLVMGYRYDHRHRAMGGSGGGRTARQTRLDGREKEARWGAGGGG